MCIRDRLNNGVHNRLVAKAHFVQKMQIRPFCSARQNCVCCVLLSRRDTGQVGSRPVNSGGSRALVTLSVRPVATIPVLLVNVFIVPSDQLDFGINFCVIMDCLPPETQEQLKKMSNVRLAAKLGRAGYDSQPSA